MINSFENLEPRTWYEEKVLTAKRAGKTYRQIADELHITPYRVGAIVGRMRRRLLPRKVLPPIQCLNCDKHFEPSKHDSRLKFCCWRCNYDFDRKRRLAASNIYQAKCPGCGMIFTTKNPRQRFCLPTCRSEYEKGVRDRARWQREKAEYERLKALFEP